MCLVKMDESNFNFGNHKYKFDVEISIFSIKVREFHAIFTLIHTHVF